MGEVVRRAEGDEASGEPPAQGFHQGSLLRFNHFLQAEKDEKYK